MKKTQIYIYNLGNDHTNALLLNKKNVTKTLVSDKGGS